MREGAIAGAESAGGIDPGGGAGFVGDPVERHVLHDQAVHGVEAQMRARGDEFGDGGVGGEVFRFGGHVWSLTPGWWWRHAGYRFWCGGRPGLVLTSWHGCSS